MSELLVLLESLAPAAPVALVAHGLRALVVLALGGLVALALRRHSAATRHLAWSVTVTLALALPVLGALGPDLTVAVPASLAGAGPTPGHDPAAPGPARPTPSRERQTTGPSEAADTPPASGPRSGGDAAPTATGPGVPGAAGPGWSVLVTAVWAGGAAFLLGLLAVEHLRIVVRAFRARHRTAGHVAALARRLAREADLAPVRLLVSPHDDMPITWGLVRPTVMLPRGCDRWSPRRLELVLRHELAHVARRDHLVQVLGSVLAALHWPDPLAWLAVHRLRVERENACDDAVLRSGFRPSSYAGELLEIARTLRARRLAAMCGLALARPSQLGRRLVTVLETDRCRAVPRRGIALLATALGVAGALVVAGLTPVAAAPAPVGGPGAAAGSPATSGPEDAPPLRIAPPVPPSGSGNGAGTAALPGGRQERSTDPVSECWAPGVERSMSISRGGGRDVEIYEWRSRGCESVIVLSGALRFGPRFAEVTGVAPGSSFRLELQEDGGERILEIRSAADDSTEIVWRVDGRVRPFDAAARQWFSGLLDSLLLQTGIAAEERVDWLVEERGVQGALRETRRITSNSVTGRYLEALLDRDGLDDDEMRAILELAGRQIDSGSQLADVLAEFHRLHPQRLEGGAVADTFWRTVDAIDSSSTLRGLLLEIMEGQPRTSPLLPRALVEARRRISSDSTLADMLRGVQRMFPDAPLEPPLRDAFWAAVGEIESNSTLADLLVSLTEGVAPDSELLDLALATARADISSDRTLSDLLVELATRHPGAASGRLRGTFEATVREIGSRSTRERTLAELRRLGVLGDAVRRP